MGIPILLVPTVKLRTCAAERQRLNKTLGTKREAERKRERERERAVEREEKT